MKTTKLLIFLFILSISNLLYSESDPRELFRLGEERFVYEDDSLALEYYQKLIDSHPQSSLAADAQFRIGQIYYRSRDYEGAGRQFQIVADRFRNTQFWDELYFWQGTSAHALGDHQTAVNYLSEYVMTDDPLWINEALLYQGLAYKELGDERKAITSIERLIELEDEPGGYELTLLGHLYLEQERFRSLDNLFQGIDPYNFQSPWREQLLFFRAEALYLDDPESSRGIYDELSITPGQVGALSYQRLFDILLGAGEVDSLRILLDRAERDLKGEPELLNEFWLRIGIAFYNEGTLDMAEFYLRRVYALTDPEEPYDPLVSLYLARLSQKRGEYEKAFSLVEGHYSRGGENTADLLFTRGELLTRKEEWIKALVIWEELFREYPLYTSGSMASYYHGYTLHRLNRSSEALAALKPLIEAGGSAAAGLSGDYRLGLMRLLGKLYLKTGSYDNAVDIWQEYSRLAFSDPMGKKEYLRSLFLGGRYEEVLSESFELKRDPGFIESAPEVSLLASYLSGISALSLGRYETALEDLMLLGESELEAVGWENLYPYILYYRGWAHYRESRFQKGLTEFTALISRIEEEDLSDPVLFMGYHFAGWCYFQMENYPDAAESFLKFADSDSDSDGPESRLMAARSYKEALDFDRAQEVLTDMLEILTPGRITEDARFELGEVLLLAGMNDEAAETFLKLFEDGTSLAEESLYRRCEVYFESRMWEEAQASYYLYRRTYPQGAYADAAHYWGGEASMGQDESFGAVLLWERLIDAFPQSRFYGGALWKSAAIYQERGDWDKALNLINELVQFRPEEARAFGASSKEDELRYLLAGNSPEEAALRAKIESFGGAEDPEGRETILELARILLFQGGSAGDEAKRLLEEVIFYKKADLPRAARAQFYLGEWAQRSGQLDEARRIFLEAASMNPEDKDLVAISIFRAAEVAKRQEDTQALNALVSRLIEYFPQSSWADEGRLLLEAVNEN